MLKPLHLNISASVLSMNVERFTLVFNLRINYLLSHPCFYSNCHRHLVTLHDLLLHQAASNLGEKSQASNRNGHRNFFVARNGCLNGNAANLALSVDDRATVAFRLDTHANERHQARSARLAAALKVAAANTSLTRAPKTITVCKTNGKHKS